MIETDRHATAYLPGICDHLAEKGGAISRDLFLPLPGLDQIAVERFLNTL